MNLRAAIQALKEGGVVVFPTETSYGIGCDATNAKAVRRLFAIKGRPDGKGAPLIVESLKAAERWGVFSSAAKKLAKTYWPGALTLVLPVFARSETTKQTHERLLRFARKDNGVAGAVLQNKTIALRVSGHVIARALAKGLGRPLVATSANRSAEPPCFSIRAFEQQFKALPKLREGIVVVDAGALPKRKPTTLVKVIGEQVEVLRQGSIRL